jgi:predicted kinase
MSIKARKEFVAIARLHNAHLRAVVFELLRETILSRNKKRADAGGRNVPEDVIDKMLDKYQRPDKPEFDEVTFIK